MKRDRRTEIRDVAAELFATRGIGPTTVREIGDRAGVFSGSLYHYFKSKDAIVADILEDYMADIDQRFGRASARARGPVEVVRGLISATLAVIEDHPHPTTIYRQNRTYLRERGLLEPVDDASRRMRRYWISAIEAGVASGDFRDDIPAETFYRTVRDALWASPHWPNRAQYTRDEFTEQMCRLFLSGFLTADAAAEANLG